MKISTILLLFICIQKFGVSYAQLNPNKKGKEKQTIVFVCEHGAARSTIAAAYFNKLAKEQHLNYHAIFRGLIPDSTVSADTKIGLSKDGFDTKDLKTKALSKQDIETSSQIITLNCNLEEETSISKPLKKWTNIPPIMGNYSTARDSIFAKVNAYVLELKKTQKYH